MFDDRAIAEIQKVVGWRNHFNPTEIPPFTNTDLNTTESGQYYQDFHPALKLNYIEALLEREENLEDYLDRVEKSSIRLMLNELQEIKKLQHAGQDLVTNTLIHDQLLKHKPILNEDRFVGVEFCINSAELGIRACINRIGLYLTAAQPNLKLYVFNSLQEDAVAEIDFTSTNANSFTWANEKVTFDYSDGSSNEGGVWYVGYYQADLVGQAIKYDVLNWKNGYCRTCDNGFRAGNYMKIANYVTMSPFYIPSTQVPARGKLFDPSHVIRTYTNSYGLNFNISIFCNMTQFWIDNRLSMVAAIGKSVALRVLQDMRASAQISALEQHIQMLVIRDLEGDSNTKMRTFEQKRNSSIKGVALDQSRVHNVCMPCMKKGVSYHAS